jgi:hypothetical protein
MGSLVEETEKMGLEGREGGIKLLKSTVMATKAMN